MEHLFDSLRSQADEKPRSQPVLAAKQVVRTVQSQRRLSPEELDDLVSAYVAGATVKDLATRFGVHRHTIAAHLDRAGVPRHQNGLTTSQVAEAAQLYDTGWSLAKIADYFSVQPTTIYYWLRKEGIQIRSRPGWRTKQG